MSLCNGSCVDTKTDTLHCGSCTTACTGGRTCSQGMCCNASETVCNGACTDTSNDLSNCGVCGSICTGGKGCIGSTCQTVAPNVAPLGTVTVSWGGSSGNYGPAKANDNISQVANCNLYAWINGGNAPGTDWIQLTWGQARIISSINIDTNSTGTDSCGNSGRALAGAQVQWWNGASWVTATTISGRVNDWSYTFPAPVTTTQIRLYGVYAVGGGASNPLIFEWQAIGQ